MLDSKFVPEPIGKIRHEQTVRMEAITSFDHEFRVATFLYPSLEDVHCWKVVVNHFEILKFLSVDDLFVDQTELLGSHCRQMSDCCVVVEPCLAWTDL